MANRSYKETLCVVGAGTVPFIVQGLYLFAAPRRTLAATTADWLVLGVAIISGLAFVAAFPNKLRTRLIAAVVYVPMVFLFLMYGSYFYTCNKYDSCL